MTLELKSRDQFVQDEIAAIQAALPGNFQFPVGSIVRAIVEAHGGTAIWEESLVQFVLASTRLSTSVGVQCDTFVGDFGLKRLPATYASGTVTFSRAATGTQSIIPVYNPATEQGGLVSTQDGTQFFGVIIDTTNPYYNSALNAYVVPATALTANIPVQALVAGSAGNVTENSITVINSPIVGISDVTNAVAFSNGQDAQIDDQLRAYFVTYINSLSRATQGALAFAITSINQSAKYSLVENIDYTTGDPRLGYFYAVVDDGSYAPPSSFLQAVTNNLELYRGFTIQFEVHAPILTNINISATVILPAGVTLSTLQSDIVAALQLYVSLIPIGETLFYTRIAQIIYDVIQIDAPTYIDDINVTSILVNSGTSDITSDPKHEFFPNTFTITITNA